MRIERYSRGRRGLPTGCGCALLLGLAAALTVVVVLLVAPTIPGIALQAAGFQPAGSTSDVFAGNTAPVVAPVAGQRTTAVTASAGSYGTFDLGAAGVGVTVGEGVAATTVSEAELLRLCQSVTVICGAGDGRVRDASFDLRPGGGVINAEVYVSELGVWQRLGIVLTLQGNNRVRVAGIDINGALYTAPPDGLGATVAEVERVANDVLRLLTVQAAGTQYALAEIAVGEDNLTITLRP